VALNTNTNYAGLAAFSIEKVLKRDFEQVQSKSHPLLAFIKKGGKNWNKGFSARGFKMIVPVIVCPPATAAAGVTLANESGSPLSTTTGITSGLTQAEYNFAHYRANMIIRDSEIVLGGGNERGLFLQGRTEQLMDDFRRQVATDLSSITADAAGTKVLGVWWPAAATLDSGTLGNITLAATPAGSDPGWWSTNQGAATGTLSLPGIDAAYDGVRRYTNDGPDLALGTIRSGGVNVYGRFRSLLAPAERIVNADFQAKYGFVNFMYLGMTVVPDYDIGSTVDRLGLFTTKHWFYGGNDAPQRKETIRIPGTDAMEMFFTQYAGVACNNPLTMWYLNAITG